MVEARCPSPTVPVNNTLKREPLDLTYIIINSISTQFDDTYTRRRYRRALFQSTTDPPTHSENVARLFFCKVSYLAHVFPLFPKVTRDRVETV